MINQGGRFPTPWTVQTNGEGSYWVQAANGRRFGFCYFRDTTFTGSGNETHLTRDEARRLASNFARLPALLEAAAGNDDGGQEP